MEKSKLTKTKIGETYEQQSQERAYHFYDIKGTVHKEFVLAGQIVNSTYYCDFYCDCMKMCKDLHKLQQFSICENLLQRANYNKNFWKMSPPVTSCGFTVMTLKPNNNPHNGRALLHLTPKKHNSCTREWKQCCLFFQPLMRCHYEFVPDGQTTNQDFYLAVLRCLQDAVWRKWPEMWTVGSWLLHHDSASVHTALSIRQFLAKHLVPTLPKPPYSPNLFSLDFFLEPYFTHIVR
jgi:hypothetical protein